MYRVEALYMSLSGKHVLGYGLVRVFTRMSLLLSRAWLAPVSRHLLSEKDWSSSCRSGPCPRTEQQLARPRDVDLATRLSDEPKYAGLAQ
jgi:hypothetical protein